eukprot:132596-Pleurochrysis_carterae.AAC.1
MLSHLHATRLRVQGCSECTCAPARIYACKREYNSCAHSNSRAFEGAVASSWRPHSATITFGLGVPVRLAAVPLDGEVRKVVVDSGDGDGVGLDGAAESENAAAEHAEQGEEQHEAASARGPLSRRRRRRCETYAAADRQP